MARAWQQRPVSDARQQTTTALLDAAEHLLYEVGYAGVTTRSVAEAAGVRPGLVHYYFGSMEELLTQTLERFVDQLAAAVDALYADPDLSFADKWRLGSQFWVEEPTSRFPKVLMELLAVGWNLPALKARLTSVHARFRAIFERHFGQALCRYGLDENEYPLKVIVAAVTSFQLGLIVEGLSDVHEGHQELLDWIQRWVDDLEAGAADPSAQPHSNPPSPPAQPKRRGRSATDNSKDAGR
jgi:AcrR family transcriptional regulator